MVNPGIAVVSLPYRDLVQLIGELDARAHDLQRFAHEARRYRDAEQESRCHEHRNEVLRLREYLQGYARALVTTPAAPPAPRAPPP
jgi:hypothetical protein